MVWTHSRSNRDGNRRNVICREWEFSGWPPKRSPTWKCRWRTYRNVIDITSRNGIWTVNFIAIFDNNEINTFLWLRFMLLHCFFFLSFFFFVNFQFSFCGKLLRKKKRVIERVPDYAGVLMQHTRTLFMPLRLWLWWWWWRCNCHWWWKRVPALVIEWASNNNHHKKNIFMKNC